MIPFMRGFVKCLAGLVLLISLAFPALAQLDARAKSYYEDWLRTANRAENVIDASRASNLALEQLRSELADFRQTFQVKRGENGERIQTLQGQLDALGAAPGEGEEEPEDIAQLRAALTQQLNQLKVPRIVAEEAYSRADGLINEVDKIVRERLTKRLFERGTSPLNPEHWPGALRDLVHASRAVGNETLSQLRNDTTSERISGDLVGLIAVLLIGLLLITRGRSWAHRAGDYLRRYGARGTGVWTFVVSLLQVLLPLIGVIFLAAAVDLSGILGVRGSIILDSVPAWAFLILSFHWLGEQLYANQIENDLLPVQEGNHAETRFLIDMMAVILVLQDAFATIERIQNIPESSAAVYAFPLITCAALILLRLHRIGAKQRQAQSDEDGEEGAIAAGANKIIAVVRRSIYLLGFAGPVLAAIGYLNAAEAVIYPSMLTLAVLAGLFVLHRFLGDLYGFVSGKGTAARDSLFTALIGFALALLALPLLALIWGARVADLTELWSNFLEGFQIGDTRISPTAFLTFVTVFAVGYGLTRLVQGSLRNALLPKTRIDIGGQNAIASGMGYVGIFLAALVAISMAGLDLSSLAIVAGALSVGIGFGLQTIVSNFVSGIILLVERPVSKGDWIEVGGLMGYVRDISVRSTRIETFDRTDVIVPNSDLITGTVTNYTRGNTVGRVIVPVGVSYGTDPRKVEAILMEVAKAHPMVLMNPAPSVVFQGFGADSLDFEIRAILRDVNWVLSVKSDMNYDIARRFEEAGIEIPFAQRDIWIRNPDALATAATEAAQGIAAPEASVAASNPPPSPVKKRPDRPDLDDLSSGDDGEGSEDGDGDADR
ncbi:DUF3772 domain-containing protein [Phaeobacter piscinae]|uniref:DUF3772 domain-containing protein n=1 Tax=Phaeobacter piscinae TaxID=1580596 RepID=UPI000C9A51F3|nr:DUF3772 domain-containing protein [Phaeobacter piscinae]AUQ74535.1 Small-conductance mechanosensitive channel [Phaeobacter piscinae]